MRTTTNNEMTCAFCGRTRMVTCWSDDGRDYNGHARGQGDSGVDDAGCNCPLGKLAHEQVEIKPMCLNCAHQKGEYCYCETVLQSISKMFDVGDRVGIRDTKAVCEHYELNLDIMRNIVKAGTVKSGSTLW